MLAMVTISTPGAGACRMRHPHLAPRCSGFVAMMSTVALLVLHPGAVRA